jgi:hypothetical protein
MELLCLNDEFFHKHNIELSYEIKFNEHININNIIHICEINKIEFKKILNFTFVDVTGLTVYIKNYRIKIMYNSIYIYKVKNYDYLLLINELTQLFNVICDNIHILVYHAIVKNKPDMTSYYQSLNTTHVLTQYDHVNVKYIKYKSHMAIYSNHIFMCAYSSENIKNMYMHMYATTKLPYVLNILSDHSNSLFKLLPYEVVSIILKISQC